MLEGWEDRLLEAARVNGYVAKYGEEDALRIIESGARRGHASRRTSAARKWLNFFQPGDKVLVTFRQCEYGAWNCGQNAPGA